MGKINFILRTSFLLALGIVCCFAFTIKNAFATWNEAGQFNNGRGVLGYTIYFIDAKTGFVGFGSRTGIDNTPIWKTSDSGVTWVSVTSPSTPSNGYVSDIWFGSPNDGWATIRGSLSGGLWHSTDTGNTWTQCNSFIFQDPSSVRKTSKGLCVAGDQFGVVFSSDTAVTFTKTLAKFTLINDESTRGLDFVDSAHIVCTPFESTNYYYSSDGGVSWFSTTSPGTGGDSWGIWGEKGSSTFFVAPEDIQATGKTSNVFRSDDYGATWRSVSNLSFKTTGDIKGTGCGMFIQNSNDVTGKPLGIYRSVDQGVTWKNIGGPGNNNDTRFAIINGGEIIYAFDENGVLWETTDGGDGFVGNNIATLTVNTTAIDFGSGTSCNKFDSTISCTNSSCGPFTLNSWGLSQGSTEFAVSVTGQSLPITLLPGQTDLLNISYISGIKSGIGQIYDTAILSSDADSGAVIRIPVTVNITSNATRILSIDTTTIVFDSGVVCSSAYTWISFKNSGCSPLTVFGWSMSQSGSSFNAEDGGLPDSLSPGQEGGFFLDYSSGSGLIYDTVVVTSNADNGPVFRIPVVIYITPMDSVNFVVALSNDPVKPDSILTVTISPDRVVQGVGLTSISGTVEYYSDSYDFISASGGGGATFQYTAPYAIGKTAHLPFTITSATDITLDPATPILKILLKARLSDTIACNFVLDSLLLDGSILNYEDCVLAYSSDTAVSHTLLACGDTLLLLAMRNQLVFDVENPQPDPITSEDGYQSLLILHSATDGIAEVRVTDMLGRMVTSNSLALNAGESANYSLDLSRQPSGSYFYAVQFSSQYGIATKSGTVMVLR